MPIAVLPRPSPLLALLILVAGGCTDPPELDLAADPAAPPLRIVVTALHAAGDPVTESPEGIAFAQLLQIALGLADDVEIYPPERTVLIELEGVLTSPQDLESRRRIGSLLGVDAVLSGRWRRSDGDLVVEVTLDAADSANSATRLAAARTSGEDDGLPVLASELVTQLRRGLGLPATDITAELAHLAPARLDPLITFAEGRRRLWLSDPLPASELLGAAVATDPNLPLPQAALARSLFALGRVGQAEAIAERARELGAGLSAIQAAELAILAEHLSGRPRLAVRYARRLASTHPLHREVHWDLARALLRARDGDWCREVLEQLRHLDLGSAGELEALLLAAEVARLDRDGERLLRLAGEAEQRAADLGLELPRAQAKLLLAEALLIAREPGKAAAAATEAREIFLAFSHRRQAAAALAYRARALYQQRQPAQAAYRQALAELRRERDPRSVAALLNNLAVIEQRERRPQAAVELYLESLEMRTALNDWEGAARTLGRLAELERQRWQPQRAIDYYRQALEHWRRAGRVPELIETGLALAALVADGGDLEGAAASLDWAVTLAERSGAAPLEARGRAALGDVLLQQGELEAAAREQQTALRLSAAAGERAGEARARLALATIAIEERQLAEAQVMAGTALDELILLGDRPAEALCRAVLAWALLELGDERLAADHMDRARELAADLEDPRLRLFLETADARLRWALGNPLPARSRLEAVAAEAYRSGLTAARLEAELVLGEIELNEKGEAGDGEDRLLRVEREAREAGLLLIAMRAAAARNASS